MAPKMTAPRKPLQVAADKNVHAPVRLGTCLPVAIEFAGAELEEVVKTGILKVE